MENSFPIQVGGGDRECGEERTKQGIRKSEGFRDDVTISRRTMVSVVVKDSSWPTRMATVGSWRSTGSLMGASYKSRREPRRYDLTREGVAETSSRSQFNCAGPHLTTGEWSAAMIHERDCM